MPFRLAFDDSFAYTGTDGDFRPLPRLPLYLARSTDSVRPVGIEPVLDTGADHTVFDGAIVQPSKRMAAGALFFDATGHLLLVKPTYTTTWNIPGGVIETDESAKRGCLREVREELGLDVPIGRLIAVDYTSTDARSEEKLVFLFDGGVLDAPAIVRIRLPPDELSAYRLVLPEEAPAVVNDKMARRLPPALRAQRQGHTVYLHDGDEA